MRHVHAHAFLCLALIGCSDNEPDPVQTDAGAALVDSGPSDNGDIDAGVTICDRTDPVSGLCLAEGLGAQALCGDGEFPTGHAWIANAGATQVIYVSPNGSGDGSSQDLATSLVPALSNGVDSAIVVLSKGTHDLALPQVGDLTVIGACPEQTTLSLGVRGPLSAGTGDSLRLWGLTLVNTANGDSGRAVVANEASIVTIHQTIFAQSHQAIAIDDVASVTLSNNTIEQTAGVALGVRGPLSSVIVGDNHFKGPIGGDHAIDVESGSEISFENNTIAEVSGTGLGVRGPLSSVIVGDNHFLGPLGGEGVFLGPLGGEGVFRVSGNDFEAVGGDALAVMESSLSGQISGNTFGAQVSGDGISLIGNAAGSVITVSENNFTSVGGTAIIVAEGSASYELTSNTVNGSGDAGICVIDLTGPGSATLTSNQVSNAIGIGVELLRNSAEIEMVSNTVTGTSAGEIGPLSVDTAMAYGVALFDSKSTRLRDNTITNNDTAGVVADMADWGAYALRGDLSGNSNVALQGNSLTENGTQMTLNLVVQNLNREAQLESDVDPEQPGARDLLPTTRSGRAFRCGNGEINGAEECDPGIRGGNENCTANCRIPRGRTMAGGDGYFCATSNSGRVFCRGNNAQGQVDPTVGTSLFQPLTRRDDIPVGSVEIAAGKLSACVRRFNGEVVCWGGGQLGRNESPRSAQAARPVLTENGQLDGARRLSVGARSSCAVVGQGEIWCWGEGPLGEGSYPPRLIRKASRLTRGSPTADADRQPVDDARQVTVGDSFGCYIDSGDSVRCWGALDKGQLGVSLPSQSVGQCRDISGRRQICLNHAVANGVEGASMVRAGAAHACALVEGGAVICWGDNSQRQARLGVNQPVLAPSSVGGITGAVDLALGAAHSCSKNAAGRVICWGANDQGERGLGANPDENLYGEVITARGNPISWQENIFAMSAATCGVSANGALQCWGDGFESYAAMVTRLPR